MMPSENSMWSSFDSIKFPIKARRMRIQVSQPKHIYFTSQFGQVIAGGIDSLQICGSEFDSTEEMSMKSMTNDDNEMDNNNKDNDNDNDKGKDNDNVDDKTNNAGIIVGIVVAVLLLIIILLILGLYFARQQPNNQSQTNSTLVPTFWKNDSQKEKGEQEKPKSANGEYDAAFSKGNDDETYVDINSIESEQQKLEYHAPPRSSRK